MNTTVVLADDHEIVRHGIRALLEAEADLCVVGEASCGLEAIRLVERLKPNVLIVDIMMPSLGGLEVIRQVRQRNPQVRTIVFSMFDSEAYVLKALQSGANGYVLKEASLHTIVQAVRTVVAGESYLSAPLTQRAIEAYIERARSSPATDSYDALTDREREVLCLTVDGLSNTEIGERLFISPRTVETHRAKLMHKLNLRTQADLIRYAIKRGILPMEE